MEYVSALQIQLNNAWMGLVDPKKALDTAVAEWNAITDRRGRDIQKTYWEEAVVGYISLFGHWP